MYVCNQMLLNYNHHQVIGFVCTSVRVHASAKTENNMNKLTEFSFSLCIESEKRNGKKYNQVESCSMDAAACLDVQFHL